jgi:hypothetical protein
VQISWDAKRAAGEAEAGLWDCDWDQGEWAGFGKAAAGLPPTGAGGKLHSKKRRRFYSCACKMARLGGSKGKEMGGLERGRLLNAG